MANIKSAKKRVLVDRRNEERNKAIRSSAKTAIKKVYTAVENGDKSAARAFITRTTLLTRLLRWLRLLTRWLDQGFTQRPRNDFRGFFIFSLMIES